MWLLFYGGEKVLARLLCCRLKKELTMSFSGASCLMKTSSSSPILIDRAP